MYRLTETGFVLRTSDYVTIPQVADNTDYREYLGWLAEGNVPEPFIPPPSSVPQSVTRFQARAALLKRGLLGTVNELMSAPGADPFAKLAWEDAQEFKRDSPTVLALASSLGLTASDLDELFRLAATIDA